MKKKIYNQIILKMSKIHKKTGSVCMICDEPYEKSIMFHKTRRQTHVLCLDCGIGYLKPILRMACNNVRKNIRNGAANIRCPGAYHSASRNQCKHVVNIKDLKIPYCEISMDIFRLTYTLSSQHIYMCPEEKCGQVIEVDPTFNGNMLKCLECGITWCRACLAQPFHTGKSCIEYEAENKNTENGKFILEMKRKGKLKFCPQCRAATFKNNGCFLGSTKILLWDRTIKQAKDIIIGDELIGDDGLKRTVQSLISGIDTMYDIQQNNACNYVVNSQHILVLKAMSHKYVCRLNDKWNLTWFDNENNKYRTRNFTSENNLHEFRDKIRDDDTVHITVVDYLNLPKTVKNSLVGFRSDGSNWNHRDIKIDPYILGTWLGNGDINILDDRKLSGKKTKPLTELLNEYNLVNNKHIPKEYMINDRNTRLSLLAGIIDTDGCVVNKGKRIIIIQTDPTLSNQIIKLSRSLGFMTKYRIDQRKNVKFPGSDTRIDCKDCYRINISGDRISEIPTRIKRKKCVNSEENKNYLRTAIKIVELGQNKYYGFSIDANKRFILPDYTVVHNCNKMICSSCNAKWCWLCTATGIDYDHYNSGNVGGCTGRLWEGVDENGNAIPDNQ